MDNDRPPPATTEKPLPYLLAVVLIGLFLSLLLPGYEPLLVTLLLQKCLVTLTKTVSIRQKRQYQQNIANLLYNFNKNMFLWLFMSISTLVYKACD